VRRTDGLSFAVRMGINSGEVVVGTIGDDLSLEYTAVGHTVGLAERMESAHTRACTRSVGPAAPRRGTKGWELYARHHRAQALLALEGSGSPAPEELEALAATRRGTSGSRR
jgi:hypothetical protein